MGKAILIFSDGTGQSGGITFDENRSNIYKLYRATRCGPDSCIDPQDQVAFYDPGLGSPGAGSFIRFKIGRQLYNLASSMTGLGISLNIIDCYAAIIRLYREGDRIFLFGFSRGAYTIRSLAAVIAKCGVPRQMPDGSPVPLDVAGSRKLATTAVKDVYQFCYSRKRDPGKPHQTFLLDTRERIAARFRCDHKSFCPEDIAKCDPKHPESFNPLDPGRANAYPYFIGAFDTVAAIGRPAAVAMLIAAAAVLLAGGSYVGSLLTTFSDVPLFGWVSLFAVRNLAILFFGAAGIATLYVLLRNYLKFDFRVSGYHFRQSLATIHLNPPKFHFEDYTLSAFVEYAKHTISIDENRKDFKRVHWDPDDTRKETRDQCHNIHFEQVWFPGVHSDVGGGYIESEARLSDGTLAWMLAAACMIPEGIKYDASVLRLHPGALGPQHDEFKAGHWQFHLRDLPRDKNCKVIPVTMHKSVYERFKAPKVVQYDVEKPYRPDNLREHPDFAGYYKDPPEAPPAQLVAVARNIEHVWEQQKVQTALASNPGSQNS
jgi:hypothetical protein